MRKIFLVIQREYMTRIKKPSFWILTIVVPILLAAIYAIPIYMATKPLEKTTVLVVDETGIFQHSFESSDDVQYLAAGSLDYAKQQLQDSDSYSAIVYIPARETTIPNDAFLYYRSKTPSMTVQSDVDRQLQTILRNNILLDVHNISADDYNLIRNTKIKIHTQDIETGRDGYLTIKLVLGLILAFLIFTAIFSFGSQVMRGVMEEKTSRIVEIIVCSVRPFQLMMGKVVGIGLLGLTQFALWILLSGGVLLGLQATHADLFQQAEIQHQGVTELATKGAEATAQMEAAESMQMVSELVEGLVSINFPLIIGLFIFYFILGYLLYASLFAAVGAITDNETDSQQFTLPLTIPLLLTFLFLPAMLNEPSGSLATWLSIIPFTSPIAMMFRIPFGVPGWQVSLSMVLLLVAFPLCIWLAAYIYRRGILLYGKKITWRDLFSWLKK